MGFEKIMIETKYAVLRMKFSETTGCVDKTDVQQSVAFRADIAPASYWGWQRFKIRPRD
jgi:hypothetical protein